MGHTLVTFLGRVPRHQPGYQQTTYTFPDGSERRANFICWPLARWLEVDQVVVMGTPGSMWDELLSQEELGQSFEDQYEQLMEDVEVKRVSQAQLDAVAPVLSEALDMDIRLALIPEALEEAEQVQLLTDLAHAAPEKGRLSMDVTHGFRHLPMLGLTAALYLRSVRPALNIEGLWYGAHNSDMGLSKLTDLSGLLHINDWIAAWQRFDWLGDYGAVSPLIEAQDRQLAHELKRGAYLEGIHRGQQARGHLRTARKRLAEQPLAGPGQLFQPELEARTAWVEGQQLYLRQRDHAYAALEREDYMRAALYGFEAFITKLVQENRSSDKVNDPQVRQAEKEHFEDLRPREIWRDYRILRDLRNVLAHGNEAPAGEVQSALAAPDKLRDLISRLLGVLLAD